MVNKGWYLPNTESLENTWGYFSAGCEKKKGDCSKKTRLSFFLSFVLKKFHFFLFWTAAGWYLRKVASKSWTNNETQSPCRVHLRTRPKHMHSAVRLILEKKRKSYLLNDEELGRWWDYYKRESKRLVLGLANFNAVRLKLFILS